MGYRIWDAERDEFLAAEEDFDFACLLAEGFAVELAAGVVEQLAANGEGHPGGIPIRVAVHEAGTGLPVAVHDCLTTPVLPRRGPPAAGTPTGWSP